MKIWETIDLNCYDDDGNPRAAVTIGDVAEDNLLDAIDALKALSERIPEAFRNKATLISTSRGLGGYYSRPLTDEEIAKKAAAFEAEGLEEEREEYLRLKAKFEPTDGLPRDPSGEAHEPLNLSEAA